MPGGTCFEGQKAASGCGVWMEGAVAHMAGQKVVSHLLLPHL